MEILNNVSVIIQIILFLAFIILVVSLIGYVKKLMTKIEDLQNDVNKFKVRLDPLIDDTQELVKKLNRISEKVDDNITIVKTTLEKVRDAAENVIDFKDRIIRTAEPPILDTVKAFSAIVKGVKTFVEKWKSGKEVHSGYSDDNLLFDSAPESDFDINKEYDDINKELNEVRKKLEEMKKV